MGWLAGLRARLAYRAHMLYRVLQAAQFSGRRDSIQRYFCSIALELGLEPL